MRRSAIVLLILSLVLVACRASTAESTVVADPSGASTTTSSAVIAVAPTTLPDESPLSSETAAIEEELAGLEAEQDRLRALLDLEVQYPVVILESGQGPVRLESRPMRIVSLSATHTEMLYAVGAGDQVVATDLTSNYPAGAKVTAKVDSFAFSIEEVAALEPDLVILAFDFQGEGEALSALSIPFLLLGPPDTLEGALSQTLTVGLATAHLREARDLVLDLISEAAMIIGGSAPIRGVTIYHEVDETLYSTTSTSFIGDLYSRLGLVNIADDADVGGAFPQLSAEFIVDQDPEIIFLADANFGVTPEVVAARPGWDTIRAVTNGNIVELDGDLAGRWGPRTVDLLRSILEAVEARAP